MKTNASFKHILKDYLDEFKLLVLIFFVALLLLNLIVITFGFPIMVNSSFSIDLAIYTFLLVAVLQLREQLPFALQNGETRKNFWLSKIISTLVFCVLLSIFDVAVLYIPGYIKPSFLLSDIDALLLQNGFVLSVVRHFPMLLVFGSLGLVMGAINIRTTRKQKFLIYGGISAVFFVGLPFLDLGLLNATITRALINLLVLMAQNAAIANLISVFTFLVFSLVGWLIIRKYEF